MPTADEMMHITQWHHPQGFRVTCEECGDLGLWETEFGAFTFADNHFISKHLER